MAGTCSTYEARCQVRARAEAERGGLLPPRVLILSRAPASQARTVETPALPPDSHPYALPLGLVSRRRRGQVADVAAAGARAGAAACRPPCQPAPAHAWLLSHTS